MSKLNKTKIDKILRSTDTMEDFVECFDPFIKIIEDIIDSTGIEEYKAAIRHINEAKKILRNN